jgi:hypothetical protein
MKTHSERILQWSISQYHRAQRKCLGRQTYEKRKAKSGQEGRRRHWRQKVAAEPATATSQRTDNLIRIKEETRSYAAVPEDTDDTTSDTGTDHQTGQMHHLWRVKRRRTSYKRHHETL